MRSTPTRDGDCDRPAATRSRARLAVARHEAADVREPLARHQARDDLDRRQLRHRARQAAREACPPATTGHGARLSVDRMPRHHRARSRNAGRAAAASSSFFRVRGAGRLGQRPAASSSGLSSSSRAGATTSSITTAAGLYRYFMNDLVEVTGRFAHAAAPIRSEGKRRHQPDRRKALRSAGHRSRSGRCASLSASRRPFFMLVADEAASVVPPLRGERCGSPAACRPSVAAAVDHRLGELNIEYHSKRASGRLAPLTLAWLRHGAGEAYKARVRPRRPARRTVQAGRSAVRRKDWRLRSNAMSIALTCGIDRIQFQRAQHSVQGRVPSRIRGARGDRDRLDRRDRADGIVGSGESCPRLYVTGRNDRHGPRVHRRGTKPSCRDRYHECWRHCAPGSAAQRHEIDANPAAWCALELALLDLLGKRQSTIRSKRCCRCRRSSAEHSTTPPFSAMRRQPRSSAMAEQYRQLGFRDFKVKLSGDSERDRDKMSVLRHVAGRGRFACGRMRTTSGGTRDEAIAGIAGAWLSLLCRRRANRKGSASGTVRAIARALRLPSHPG